MAIHQEVLNKARVAGARLAEAEARVQQARVEYHAIVRRVHLAGASLREIAEALGLSHQRVQQMVDGAGGSWWKRVWRSRNLRRDLICTFCGRPQDQVEKLIAGPKVFICGACVAFAERTLCGSTAASGGALALAGDGVRTRCSFCGKRRTPDRALLAGPEANICGACLDVCRQILTDCST